MIDFFKPVSSAINLIKELYGFRRDHIDSFRKEAQRVIDAFEAHDIPPNEVMRLLPEGLLDDPSDLGSARSLKKHLAKVSPWTQSTLRLNPAWLKGRSSVPHQIISSYKHLTALVEFLQAREQESADMSRFTVYVFKQDVVPIELSSGPMVIILAEDFAEIDEVELTRFYYLSERLEFGHLHCLLNLMHVMAFAHHYGIRVWGRVMKPAYLARLERGEGFIPTLWRGEIHGGWYPEDILWTGLSGDPAWKETLQADLDAQLRGDGFSWFANEIDSERKRLASSGQGVVTS